MTEEKKELTKETKAKTTRAKKTESTVDNALEQYKAMIDSLSKQVEDLTEALNKEKEENSKSNEVTNTTKQRPKKRMSLSELKGQDIWLRRQIGGIGYVAYGDKTGYIHIWEEIGDEDYVDGEELQKMKRAFLETGKLIIVDRPDVVEALDLTKTYEILELFSSENNLKDKSLNELYALLNGINPKFKNAIAINVAQGILNGDINNIGVIKKLEKVLDKDFGIE